MRSDAFKPTADQRRTVEELIATGSPQHAIAKVIGCDPKTLRRAFADELANGHAVRRAEIVALLFAQARQGSVNAQRTLEAMTRTPPDAPLAPSKPLGKKEQANLDAQTAHIGTAWESLIN